MGNTTRRSFGLVVVGLFLILIYAVVFLLFERATWKTSTSFQAELRGTAAAELDFNHEQFLFLQLNPNSDADFTGQLQEGVEVWNHPYAEGYLFSTPYRIAATSYVESFNRRMSQLIRTMPERPSAVIHRISQLNDPEWKTRQNAAEMLGKMRDAARSAVPSLIKSTQDEMPEVRATAAWALAAIGSTEHDKDTVAALEILKETPNPKMQEVASRALDHLRQNAGRNLEDASSQ